jgi:hypothetical protein
MARAQIIKPHLARVIQLAEWGDETGKVRLSQEQLALLVGGIDLKQTRAKDWYSEETFEQKVGGH